MLELEDALKKILFTVEPLGTETLPLEESMDRFLASPVISQIDLPPFDNSAMDGYAVRAEDVQSASRKNPAVLKLIGTVAAGESSAPGVNSGSCIRIFTGSLLPQGATAVVMQEDTRTVSADANQIEILDSVKPWENIRFAGEDVKSGAVLLRTGHKLTASACSLAAACGFSSMSVFRKPVVGLLATGSELVAAGQPLEPGRVYESNRIGLSVLARRSGAIPKIYPLVKDSLQTTASALNTAFEECDVVITSGGVSVGEFDFVKSAFEKIGGELSFWKIAIKPGKPFVFGRLRDKLLFGLPGNPVSALITAFLLVRPTLLRMQGAEKIAPLRHPVTLCDSIFNYGDRRHFIRISIDADGSAKPVKIQGSHILSGLAEADGLIDVPPKTVLTARSTVNAIRWD